MSTCVQCILLASPPTTPSRWDRHSSTALSADIANTILQASGEWKYKEWLSTACCNKLRDWDSPHRLSGVVQAHLGGHGGDGSGVVSDVQHHVHLPARTLLREYLEAARWSRFQSFR